MDMQCATVFPNITNNLHGRHISTSHHKCSALFNIPLLFVVSLINVPFANYNRSPGKSFKAK